MSRVNLFLIGVNKAGTSWLYRLLSGHPDVFMSGIKELYYFGDLGPRSEGIDEMRDYHAHFPFDADYRYFGDATVMYYRDPEVAAAIQEYNPDAKLLAIVRDPIERLRSQYRYHKQLGLLDETTTLAEAAFDRDTALLRDSHYERTLPAFADRFGAGQFRVVSLEAGKATPDDFWAELLSFLDLSSGPRPEADRPENPTGSPAFRRVYRGLVQPLRKRLPRVYEWMLQSPWAHYAKRGLLGLLGTAEASALPSDLEARLRDEFAPTYAYLRDLGFDIYDAPVDSPADS